MLTQEQIREFLIERGYKLDRWNHMIKTGDDGRRKRFKFQARVLRYEVKGSYGWLMIYSGYYSKLSFKLTAGGNRILSGMEPSLGRNA